MLNLNNIIIPESQSSTMNQQQAQKNFPTDGFKSILESTDLLDLLMKPMDDIKKDGFETYATTNESFTPDFNNLNFDDLLKPSKEYTDHDYFEYDAGKLEFNCDDNSSKTYGNPYLGPNLWEKKEIFQGEKFGVEYLGVDDFLNDNSLNDEDIKFLDNLQSSCSNELASSEEPAKTQIYPQATVAAPVLKKSESVPTPIGTLKVKDDSKIIAHSIPAKQSISKMISKWQNENDEEDMNSDNDELPSKKFFEERLVLQTTIKKSKKQFVPNDMKDEKYWARRKKNNVAAKRSRDTRRFKENQIVIAATYLEHENDELRKQLEECKAQMVQMQAKIDRFEQRGNN